MFVKGKSGNPNGRRPEDPEVKNLARKYCKAAIKRLAELIDSDDERIAIAASQAILDRGFGKPVQAVEHAGEMHFDVQIVRYSEAKG